MIIAFEYKWLSGVEFSKTVVKHVQLYYAINQYSLKGQWGIELDVKGSSPAKT